MRFSVLRSSLLQGAFCVACASVASADMTTVGSVGIVDPADVAKIVANDTSVTLSFAQPGQQHATIRYNVSLIPAVPGNGTTRWTLKVRYQDGDSVTSETQRLLVHLKELELSTGLVTTVLTFDSNVRLTTDPAASESDWMLRTVSGCRGYHPDSAYFLEAVFSSDATPTAPLVRLGGMALGASEFGDVEDGACS